MTYTTIEQSKALINLGLDEKTADLYYQQTDDAVDRWEVHIGNMDVQNEFPQIPCWSAETLLNILPIYAYKEDEEYFLDIDKTDDNTYSIGYRYESYAIRKKGKLISTLFEIVEWLLINKLI